MNMIKLIDKIKTEIFPLHDHYASDLDQHSRELYATMLASVVLNKGQISEVESRLFSMLLDSLDLEANTAKYLNLAQQVNLEQTREFFNDVLEDEEMQTAFLMDALILSRIEQPLNDTQMELMAELCDAVDLDEDELENAVQYTQLILGMDDTSWYELEESIFNGKLSEVAVHFDFGFEKMQPDYENGVWIDRRTGLMWSRISLGQQWQGGKAVGTASTFNWHEAQEAAKSCTLAGFNDWRVPEIHELRNIAIKSGYDCPEGVLFQPSNNTWGDYWSSSSIEKNPSNNFDFSIMFGGTLDAWFMRFSDMTSHGYRKRDHRFYARVVRRV